LPLSLHVRRAGQATRVWEGREKAVATTPPWQLLPDVRRGLRLSSARPLRGPDFIDSVKGSQNALPRCLSVRHHRPDLTFVLESDTRDLGVL
jgi:hypothetical protein